MPLAWTIRERVAWATVRSAISVTSTPRSQNPASGEGVVGGGGTQSLQQMCPSTVSSRVGLPLCMQPLAPT